MDKCCKITEKIDFYLAQEKKTVYNVLKSDMLIRYADNQLRGNYYD
jgi:hypothetical protein